MREHCRSKEIRFARVKTNPLNGVKGDRIVPREARSFSSKGRRHRVPFEDDWNRRWRGISESGLNTVSVMRHRLVSPRNGNARSGKILSSPFLSLSPLFRFPRARELIALFPMTWRDLEEKATSCSRDHVPLMRIVLLFSTPFVFFTLFSRNFFSTRVTRYPPSLTFFPSLADQRTKERRKKRKRWDGSLVLVIAYR